MATKIRVLDELTINQIAAGEVIENPSSVVKELVENALDAGSNEITVEIKGGGRQLIRVTDNGCGMERDDALLCIERHATSKLKRFHDLDSLLTMGFRGEALPSIASISHFQLMTCPSQEQMGTVLIVEGGKIVNCSSCAHSPGTTIEVKNLFFNVPVRRKFQKSPSFDTNEILKNVIALSLAHPRIRFTLVSDASSLLNLPENRQENFLEALKIRIRDALGTEFAEDLVAVSASERDYKIEGLISLPFHHRPNRQAQFLFVNGRYVQSSLISYAIKDGYGPALPTNRYPAFVLHLTLPCEEFDINVHPQKKEVRFRKEDKLRELLVRTLEGSLQQHVAVAEPVTFPRVLVDPPEVAMTPISPVQQYASFAMPERERSISSPFKQVREEVTVQLPKMLVKPQCVASFDEYLVLDKAPDYYKDKEGVCLMHKNHANARIVYEKALKSLEGRQQCGSQALLVPVTIELLAEEAEMLRHHLASVCQLGFEIREFGERSFFVESVPEHMSVDDVDRTVKELIDSLKRGGSLAWQKSEKQKLALAASKSLLLKKGRLALVEAQSLINQLFECQQPFFSPAGKPIFAILEESFLENLFKG
ncbi:MAG: DNA mismatch repair endonuclease MutL [Parachlamydiaceae bacterium]